MRQASRTHCGDDLGGLLVREDGAHGDRDVRARELVGRAAAPRPRPTRPSRAAGARARGSRPCGPRPRPQALRERVDRGVAHDVQMPGGVAPGRGARQLDELAEPGALVGRGAGAAAVAPGVQVRQLDPQDRRPAARPAASCARRARTCPCPWSRGSAAGGSSRRAPRRSWRRRRRRRTRRGSWTGRTRRSRSCRARRGDRPPRASRRPARRPRRPGTPSASISAIGATLPNRCTAITAFVRGVSAARTVSARHAARVAGRRRRRRAGRP